MPHVFLQWASKYEENPFPLNEEIIKRRGPYANFSKRFVFWGKIFAEFDARGKAKVLEPFYRETYGTSGKDVCELLNAEISTQVAAYLYLANPYCRTHGLVIANVLQAFYNNSEYGGLPHPDEDGRPGCAHVPAYYFHDKRTEQCHECRERKRECTLRFSCHFWFKINAFEYIAWEKVGDHLLNQLFFWDSEVGRRGDVLEPTDGLVFPILVEQVKPRYYFRDILHAIPHTTGESPIIYQKDHPPEKYGLKDFFFRLARDPYVSRIEIEEESGPRASFFRADSGDCHVINGGKALNYRGKDHTLLFKVICHSESSEQQERLRDYFGKEYLNER